MLSRRSPQGRGRPIGFTLIELAIALLVLTVGLLGALALLLRATRGTSDALARSQAVVLAQAIGEAMRGNAVAMRAGVFDAVAANAPGVAPPAVAACRADSAPCSAAALAQADIARWQQSAATTLPAGAAAVHCSGDGDGRRVCAIELTWRERFTAAGERPARETFRLAVKP